MPQIPVLLEVFVIFALVVIASAKKVHLGLAAAIGGILFAFLRGLAPKAIALSIGRELANLDTILLLVLVTSIMVFSAAMKRSGVMDLFARVLGSIVPSKRMALTLAPILIGTLPMPGGAILSAPLVDSFDQERQHTPETLSATNYWFRHILELFWPLYPAFILTVTLTGLPVGRLMLVNAYAPFLLLLLGLIFILPARSRVAAVHDSKPATDSSHTTSNRIIEGFAPLVMVIGGYLALDLLWRLLQPALSLDAELARLIGRYALILTSLAGASLYLGGRYGWKSFAGTLDAHTLKLTAVVAGIKVFSALLSSAGVAEATAGELAGLGIPALAAVALLPFITGLVTGVGFGYVGLSFPIILGLIPAGAGIPMEAVVVLAGAFGFAGMMLSPLHVCIVVSSAHFGTGLLATMRRYVLPLLIFMALGSAYSFLLMRLL